MNRRAFVFVLDACGVGALPDAGDYGDENTSTLAHVAQAVGGLRLPTLGALGLGSICDLQGVSPSAAPVLHGRLAAQGWGKDSTAGHWELMGIVTRQAPPTYPQGLDGELLAQVESAIGSTVICNRPYNGIAAIDDYGERHLSSGRPILYTSQDSVLQLAAHTDVIAAPQLYAACEAVRELMHGEHAVGRVIARPFTGMPGAFERTLGRRDYALAPTSPSYLQGLQAAGVAVHGVGKVYDLFAGAGFDHAHPGADNAEALRQSARLFEQLESGLVFVNLIETDQRFGHRKDTAGFHGALRQIDDALAGLLETQRAGDLIVITADHGCDPAAEHSDHTREYAPLLASFAGHGGARHDGALADVGASVSAWLGGHPAADLPGNSFVEGNG